MDFVQEKKISDVDELISDTNHQNFLQHVSSPEKDVNSKNLKDLSIEVEISELSESNSEELEEEIVEDFRDGENDEDFVAGSSPKPKKKCEKRIIRSLSKQSSSRKRKCEFCGTLETPMWRRGPTGKGTLCNACGVKWSLKFRKRTGKKTKQVKNEVEVLPREQRHSTRNKIPRKTNSFEMKEEQSPENSFSHSIRKRAIEDNVDKKRVPKKRRAHSDDEESISEEDAASTRLLGRLLNVVEVQLVEMRQVELVRKQISELRDELHLKERVFHKQLEQQKSETIQELQTFCQEMLNMASTNNEGTPVNLVDSDSQVILDFIQNIRSHICEIRSTLQFSVSNELEKKLDCFQNELDSLQQKIEANISALKFKAGSDVLSVEKILCSREANIKSGLASLSKFAEEEFTLMNQQLDRIEVSL